LAGECLGGTGSLSEWSVTGDRIIPRLGGNFSSFNRSMDSVMPATSKPVQRKSVAKSKRRERASADADRKQQQSDLLDEALLETFPASDSVSIGRVK
jgi:hypothetical protein